MPYDQGYDDEDGHTSLDEGRGRRFKDFDCPDCAANNPYDDGFGQGDQVLCYYCGQQYDVRVDDSGRLRLRPV